MHIHFTGHQFDITPALRSFTEEKMNKLVKHCDKILDIHVTFHIEHLMHTVEASINMAKTKLHASSEAEDMYEAVDALVDKLHGQLMTHKGKQTNHRT